MTLCNNLRLKRGIFTYHHYYRHYIKSSLPSSMFSILGNVACYSLCHLLCSLLKLLLPLCLYVIIFMKVETCPYWLWSNESYNRDTTYSKPLDRFSGGISPNLWWNGYTANNSVPRNVMQMTTKITSVLYCLLSTVKDHGKKIIMVFYRNLLSVFQNWSFYAEKWLIFWCNVTFSMNRLQ
jgi:hypothetical protein